MSSLTQAAVFSKKALVFAAAGIGILLVILVIFQIAKSVLKSLVPQKPVPAMVAFGKLPKLDLSEGIKPQKIEYKLETISGQLPALPSMVKVFAVGEVSHSLGDLNRTKAKVSAAGFAKDPSQIDNSLAKFTDGRGRTITVDIVSGNFVVNSDYIYRPEAIATRPKSEEEARTIAKTFLGFFGLSGDYAKIENIIYKIDGGRLIDVQGLASGNLIQVNYMRADLDKIPVISPRKNNPNVWVRVAGDVLEAKFKPTLLQKQKFSTYPLKDVRTGFEELKAGAGFLNQEWNEPEFPIFDVSLAYLESEKYQAFLQPVYVFHGKGELLAYVEAVDPAWINSAPANNSF